MLALKTEQAGDPMSVVHPERAIPGVKRVIHALGTGKTDLMPVPGNKVNSKYIMHYYKAIRDADGRYRGVNEWVLDVRACCRSHIKRTGEAGPGWERRKAFDAASCFRKRSRYTGMTVQKQYHRPLYSMHLLPLAANLESAYRRCRGQS